MPDRPSGNGYTVLESTARTATVSSSAVVGEGHRGAHIILTATAVTAGASIVPTVEGYNSVTDAWYTILTGAALTGTGTTVLKVYPGITPVTNVAVSDVLPARWRVTMTAADSKSATYSIVANLLK